MQKVIIIGIPRSGTTLLASMIGGHPDISMMDECKSREWEKQVGKEYIGNKIACDGIVVHWNRKRIPILGAIINRALNLSRKKQLIRFSPLYHYSLKSLIGCKFIIITRDPEEVRASIMNRSKASEKLAMAKIRKGARLIAKLKSHICKDDYYEVDYISLLNNTYSELYNISVFLGVKEYYMEKMKRASKYNNRYKREL